MNSMPQQLLSSFVRSSSFVFQGRVVELGKSNLDGVKPSEKLAIVKIEDVVITPRILGNIKGENVTVYLLSNDRMKKDQQATFFATNWHYGKNIGVLEIGRTELTAKEIRQDTINEYLKQLDEKLEERIRSAKIIVSGSVISTSRSEPGKETSATEEADWHKADIRIDTVEKGDPPEGLRILFPREAGKEFMRYPTYNEGQKGVWLLHSSKDSGEEREGENRMKEDQEDEESLVATDSMDYHAICELPRIQVLLWRINT